MATWILQGNPDLYVVDGYVRLESRISWQIKQHARDVRVGDVVYVWRAAGKRQLTSGIVARARIAGLPAPTPEPADDPYRLGPYEETTVSSPLGDIVALAAGEVLTRDRIAGTDGLQGLRILKQPNSTVFPVSSDESVLLDVLWGEMEALRPVAHPEAAALTPSMSAALQLERRKAFGDPSFWASLDKALQERRTALPAMQALVRGFLDGSTSLAELRATWDSRARARPWSSYGLGGLNGGMILNKLCKHLGDDGDLEPTLRRVLAVPASGEEARGRLADFAAWIEHRIDRGLATRADLQPGRIPAMVSGFWHVQDPASWPVLYPSVRGLLARCGVTAGEDVPYGDYRRAVLGAQAATGMSHWAFDRLANWTPESAPTRRDDEPERKDSPKPPSTSHGVWLMGCGRHGAFRQLFLERGLIALGGDIGDLGSYADKDQVRAALAALDGSSDNPVNDTAASWSFLHEMKEGDEVLLKQGTGVLVARGTITGAYRYVAGERYPHRRDVAWSWTGQVALDDNPFPIKTLTRVLPAFHRRLLDEIARGGGPGGEPEVPSDDELPIARPYLPEDAARELFLDEADLETLVLRLRRKKNLILQGPPGTGKTFVAKRLAWLVVGEQSDRTVSRVQFHPSYGYEHFVEGFQPAAGGGFALTRGPFQRVCDAALAEPDRDFVVIIDEINRGHLAKIFGELLMLIENSKRSEDWAVELAYSGRRFHIPENVYLIGTMNTADRSLALVDHAMRRRFTFATLPPAFGSPRFRAHLAQATGDEAFADDIVGRLREVNAMIAADPDLGSGFVIGHSFFCDAPDKDDLGAWYADIVRAELLPLLDEYWFDQKERYERARELLEGEAT
jgi:MoxR-like ATPase